MTGAAAPAPRPLPTYEECIEKAARVYADWLAERQAALNAAAA